MRLMRHVLVAVLLAAAPQCTAFHPPNAMQKRSALLAARRDGPAVVAAGEPVCPVAMNARSFATGWGVCGVCAILGQAIARLAPHAIMPFIRKDLTLLQWGCYGGSMLLFAYGEGYSAFQKKFSPLVVQRAMSLDGAKRPVHVTLAPFYSMGLFHATPKRRTLSWGVTLGVAAVVGAVKVPPPPAHPPGAPALVRVMSRADAVAALALSVALHRRCGRLRRPALGRRVDGGALARPMARLPSPSRVVSRAPPPRQAIYARALGGTDPGVDPCLPPTKP